MGKGKKEGGGRRKSALFGTAATVVADALMAGDPAHQEHHTHERSEPVFEQPLEGEIVSVEASPSIAALAFSARPHRTPE